MADCFASRKLGHFVSVDQQIKLNQELSGTGVHISILPTYTSILFSSGTKTHCEYPELSRQHVTCTKQHLSFQNTTDILYNFSGSVWASFCYMQLYHNATASDVDSFLTHSDGTKRQAQM